jgi:CubicO group peptidase (beta-lactamase class C family)/glyoxylase-like metal-dependent hydrolase (beta-lactamase superfamily II)
MLFIPLTLAMTVVGQGPADWYEPFPAHKILGNVYYVGSKDLATYLITTPEGHILINSGFERTVPLIQKSVESLGFKMTDVKILLASHAHSDHIAGHALLQKATGAKVYVMRGDDQVIASGGKGQYLYTTSRWDPCKVDRVLKDGDEVKLGGVSLVARLTPGHTRGCTTWTWRVEDGGKKYDVVVVGSPNVNPGFQLVNNKDYPEIATDFARTFKILKSLPCDVFLGAHGSYYGMVERYDLLKKGQANAFVNPKGYKEYIAQKERAFRKTLAAQQDKADQGRTVQSVGVTLYDPDPNHLWNRLHQALHVRLTDMGNPEKEQALLPGDQSAHAYELDAFLWPNRSTYLRFGEPHKTALAVLDEFLAKDGEKLVRKPIKRAFLQRDLWAVFDWTRSWHIDVPGRNLRSRLAKAIQRLALSREEIKALPDNFAAVAAAKKVAEFPADLWDSRGPWVLIGDDNKNTNGAQTITPVHDSFFGGRSAFLVFIRAGDSRDKTIKFLKQLHDNGEPSPARFALVRRMLLIDNRGRIRLSPVTETVQIRGDVSEEEFKLNRKDFLEGKIKQSIHRANEDDRERPEILFMGYNAGDHPAPILKSCFSCHQGRDLNSRTQNFSGRAGPMRTRPRLIESTLDDEAVKSIYRKSDQFMWGKLQGLWEGEITNSDQGKAEQGTPTAGLAISDRLHQYIAAKEIAGAVTLVATPDRILHLDATGNASLNPAEKMRTDSIFWIASMSKPILATLLLMLQDEGLLSVDDPVEKYLPEFKGLKTADGKPARVTIRHLLTHTSGMGEITADQARNARTLASVIPLYVAKPVRFTPGSKWVYCQSGINTGGRIAEVVTGEPLEKLLQRRLFDPLGMKDTTFYLTEKQLPRLAKSYKRTDKGDLEVTDIRFLNGKAPTSRDRFPAPNGGLFSTASDYARFCQMVLRGGELDGKRYLKPKTVKLMTTIQTADLKTGFTEGNGWGLGWCVVRKPQGVTAMLSPGTFGHGGAYGTQAWIDPATKRIYILMVQRANFPSSDASEVRRGFQEAASEAFSKSKSK